MLQYKMFHLKTEAESILRYFVFLNKRQDDE
jgi:hypothetical protein